MIVRARVVVPDGDLASAFAGLEEIEPVASVPSLSFDPRSEFWLSCPIRQGSSAPRGAYSTSESSAMARNRMQFDPMCHNGDHDERGI